MLILVGGKSDINVPYRSGIRYAQDVRGDTIFLTENGVLQLHQLSPKCKAFRHTVANFLLWVRSKFTSKNYVLVPKDRLRALEEGEEVAVSQQRAAETNELKERLAISDVSQAEKDRKIAELQLSLTKTKQEHVVQLNALEERLLVAQNQYNGTRQELERKLVSRQADLTTVETALRQTRQQLSTAETAARLFSL